MAEQSSGRAADVLQAVGVLGAAVAVGWLLHPAFALLVVSVAVLIVGVLKET